MELTIDDDINILIAKKRLKYGDLIKSPYCGIYLDMANAISSVIPRQILFHVVNDHTLIPECECGNKVKWHDDARSYRKFCSSKCTATYTVAEKKLARVKAGLPEWHTQSAQWKEKVINTSLEKFGVTHYSKTSAFINSVVATNIAKFGTAYPSQSHEGLKKMKETFIENYGVDNPSKVPEIRTAQSTTWLSNHYSPEALAFLNDDIQFAAEIAVTPVCVLARHYDISPHPIYTKCRKLGLVLPKFNISIFEKEVSDYVSAIAGHLTIAHSDRSILRNKELDLYLPNIKLAIECNGTYWHSESRGRGSKYHDLKTIECEENGITLMHIWEHDWINKPEIVKSMISSRISATAKIYARNTTVQLIDRTVANRFFNTTHLQGAVNGNTVNLGLYDNNGTLVSVMGLGKSRFNFKYQWEILRFSTILNYTVVGGASKLFKRFIKQYNPISVLSYADRSHSTGNVYLKLGFDYVGKSRPGYHYTKDYIIIHSRHKFQKHKLESCLQTYDINLTERENMLNNGYDRIWDCGNNIYVWNRQS